MAETWYIGIDIGSTAAKAVALGTASPPIRFVVPTGWSSVETAALLRHQLKEYGVDVTESSVVATGYGRQAVNYAQKKVTEITCHAAGCAAVYPTCTVIDIGGQDTKAIYIEDEAVADFLMNDKCSAGTGKFIEVMANRLGCTIDGLFTLGAKGKPLAISSMCTVFAESEIVGYMGQGKAKEDIAAGIIYSVAGKVAQLVQQVPLADTVTLTGGLSHIPYMATVLGEKLGHPVVAYPYGRYAGAYGAALLAKKI